MMILVNREKFRLLVRCSCIVLLLTVVAVGSVVHLYSEEQIETFYKSITPDKEVQAEIDQLVSSIFSTSHPLFSEEEYQTLSGEEFWTKVIDKLKLSTGKEVDELLLQVLLAWGGKLEHRENPNAEMTKRMLIFPLAQAIPEQELISLIVPHLEKTTEPVLKKNLKQVLALVALKSFKDNASIDFVEFDPYLEKRKDNPPYSLIEFMYRIETKRATVAMARVYAGEAAANELGYKLREYYSTLREEDKELLESLSMSNQWWVRLYVARILHRQPEFKFRTPEILERLKKDKHPLVSETMSRFQEACPKVKE